MKVVIVIGYFDVFSNYGEICLGRELVRQGHEVTVIAGDRVDNIFPDAALTARGVVRNYPVGESNCEGIRIIRVKPWFHKRAMLLAHGINGIIQRIQPDLVICMKPGQMLSTCVSYRNAGMTLISIFDDNRSQYFELRPATAKIKRAVFYLSKGWCYARLIRRSDYVFTNTPNGGKIIRPLAFKKPTDVLPLSFDESLYFYDPNTRVKQRAELGWTEHDIAWITTGKVIPEKQLDLLIAIFGKLHAHNSRLRLVIIGLGKDAHSDSLRQIVHQNRLEERVTLLGFTAPAQIVRYLNAADIGVWHKRPTISIQQAMGTGLFCVLPDNDLVGHLLTASTGRYHREDDLEDLTCILRDLSSRSPEELNSERSSREQINQRFSESEIVRYLLGKVNLGGVKVADSARHDKSSLQPRESERTV